MNFANRRRSCLVLLLGAFVPISSNAFQPIHHSSNLTPVSHRQSLIVLREAESSSQEEFLEREAQVGAKKVRAMSIEERTRRAMLAEAAEDRMVEISAELDNLLGEDGLPTEENREEALNLARNYKASQEQYRNLVNGDESSLMPEKEE